MARNPPLAKAIRRALRRSGSDASTIAWRAQVTRSTMARLLRGDDQVAFGTVGDVVFHLGLQIELTDVPEQLRLPSPVPTVVDIALQRLHGG